MPTLPRASLHRFLRAFWITISRDFHSLDRLRLDKYLFLIRCYVGVAFEVFLKAPAEPSTGGANKKRKREAAAAKKKAKRSKRGADAPAAEADDGADEGEDQADGDGAGKWAALESYIALIEEGPLCPLNFDPDQPPADEKRDYVPMPHGPDGLRYHLMDIWVDELEKVLEFEEKEGEGEGQKRKPKGEVPIELILRPLEKLRAESPYKPVRVRAGEALEDERLIEWGFRTRKVEEEEEDEDEEWGGFD